MPTMDALITFWIWVYALGIASFCVLAIILIPLGARDLGALFRSLSGDTEDQDDPRS